jgi:hypothetical protein
MEAKSGRERRIAERSRVTFGMVCDAGASMCSGRVLDLSMTGAFIHTDQTHPIGTLVTLFPVGDAGDDLFEIDAKVVRLSKGTSEDDPPGMGVHFDIVSDEDKQALSTLLAKMPDTGVSSLTHMPVMRGTDLSDEEGDESRLKSMLRRLRRRI